MSTDILLLKTPSPPGTWPRQKIVRWTQHITRASGTQLHSPWSGAKRPPLKLETFKLLDAQRKEQLQRGKRTATQALLQTNKVLLIARARNNAAWIFTTPLY